MAKKKKEGISDHMKDVGSYVMNMEYIDAQYDKSIKASFVPPDEPKAPKIPAGTPLDERLKIMSGYQDQVNSYVEELKNSVPEDNLPLARELYVRDLKLELPLNSLFSDMEALIGNAYAPILEQAAKEAEKAQTVDEIKKIREKTIDNIQQFVDGLVKYLENPDYVEKLPGKAPGKWALKKKGDNMSADIRQIVGWLNDKKIHTKIETIYEQAEHVGYERDQIKRTIGRLKRTDHLSVTGESGEFEYHLKKSEEDIRKATRPLGERAKNILNLIEELEKKGENTNKGSIIEAAKSKKLGYNDEEIEYGILTLKKGKHIKMSGTRRWTQYHTPDFDGAERSVSVKSDLVKIVSKLEEQGKEPNIDNIYKEINQKYSKEGFEFKREQIRNSLRDSKRDKALVVTGTEDEKVYHTAEYAQGMEDAKPAKKKKGKSIRGDLIKIVSELETAGKETTIENIYKEAEEYGYTEKQTRDNIASLKFYSELEVTGEKRFYQYHVPKEEEKEEPVKEKPKKEKPKKPEIPVEKPPEYLEEELPKEPEKIEEIPYAPSKDGYLILEGLAIGNRNRADVSIYTSLDLDKIKKEIKDLQNNSYVEKRSWKPTQKGVESIIEHKFGKQSESVLRFLKSLAYEGAKTEFHIKLLGKDDIPSNQNLHKLQQLRFINRDKTDDSTVKIWLTNGIKEYFEPQKEEKVKKLEELEDSFIYDNTFKIRKSIILGPLEPDEATGKSSFDTTGMVTLHKSNIQIDDIGSDVTPLDVSNIFDALIEEVYKPRLGENSDISKTSESIVIKKKMK